MRANCHGLSKGDNKRILVLAVALWLHSTVTQMPWIWLLSWGSCHDNCIAGGECPAPELPQRARFYPLSEWLWNTAGTRDPSLYFCQCLPLSHWVKYANGLDRYLGKKKKKAGFSKSRFLYYFDFMALPNDSDSYF